MLERSKELASAALAATRFATNQYAVGHLGWRAWESVRRQRWQRARLRSRWCWLGNGFGTEEKNLIGFEFDFFGLKIEFDLVSEFLLVEEKFI